MGEDYPVAATEAGQGPIGFANQKVTLRENLDRRIKAVALQLQELQDTRSRLNASPTLLDCRLDDLQRAMRS